MLRHLPYILRLAHAGRVLARYGVVDDLVAAGVVPAWLGWLARPIRRRHPQKTGGERLALALQKLGPAFIKLGQTLATRQDLVGADYARDLALLQDTLPPFDSAQALAVVEGELGHGSFVRLDPTPVAAASIAQVHRAETADGRQVAVKIMRPGIEARFGKDIAFFRWLAEQLERHFPPCRRLRLPKVVDLLAATTRMELDLRMEAAAASEIAEHLAQHPGFVIPQVDWQRTSQRVLTMTWLDGTPISRVTAEQLPPSQAAQLVEQLMHGFFHSVFEHGFFHADLHHGNLFLLPDGRMALLDFGIMGRLDMENRRYLAQLIAGFLKRDYQWVAEMHHAAGYIPQHADVAAFAQACRAIAEPIMDLPVEEVSVGKLLTQLFSITETFQMETQPQLLMLQKSMVLLEGMVRKLHPEANMWKMSEPPIRQWMEKHMSLHGEASFRLKQWRQRAERLPRLMDALEAMATSPAAPIPPTSRSESWCWLGWVLVGGVVGVWWFGG